MFVYIFIVALVIVCGMIVSSNKLNIHMGERQLKTTLVWPVFAVLLFFSAFRGAFTQDYRGYVDYFERYSALPFSEIFDFGRNFSVERGFVLMCKLVSLVWDSDLFFIFVLSAVTLFFYVRFIKNRSVYPWLGVLLFISIGDYFGSFNLIRQALSAAIFLVAVEALMEKKYKKYIITVLLISLIHTSALAMLPVGFLLCRKIDKKQYIIMLGGTAVLYVLTSSVISIVQSIFSRYANYGYGMEQGSINAVIATLGVLAFVFYSIYLDKDCSFDVDKPVNRICLNGAMLSAVMLFIGGTQVYMITRLAYFLKPLAWVLVPNVIAAYSSKKKKQFFTAAICLISLVYVYITLSGSGYDPYYFIWSRQ